MNYFNIINNYLQIIIYSYIDNKNDIINFNKDRDILDNYYYNLLSKIKYKCNNNNNINYELYLTLLDINNLITQHGRYMFDLKDFKYYEHVHNNKCLLELVSCYKSISLRIHHNSMLDKLPDVIFSLQNVENIDISTSNIKELPSNIGDLTNLKSINIEKTLITGLPISIVKCKNIEILNISNCNIKELPQDIGNLVNLSFLNLINTTIIELPLSIGKCKKLERMTATREKSRISLGIPKLHLPKTIENCLNLRISWVD